MGWTIYYEATTKNSDIEQFVESANQATLVLSEGCEPYRWEAKGAQSANGFSKVQFSKTPELDYVAILGELQRLSSAWSHIRILVTDDYYLDHRDIRQVRIDSVLD